MPENEQITPKARRTRAHILNTALDLFAKNGYQATTLRNIAKAAGCSLGLAYRYFARKEEMIGAVYEQCCQDLAQDVQTLPRVTLARRFTQIVRGSFTRLSPYREAFGAIAGVALNPQSEAGVFSARMSALRTQTWSIFRDVVRGAKDAPSARLVDPVTTLLYATYLLFMLFWVHDPSPGQANTQKLLAFSEESIGRLRPLLSVPVFARSAAKLATIIAPLFAGG